jgi:16S rRNA G966 N2-methylase RsmD
VESNRSALVALRENIRTLGLESSSIVCPIPLERAQRALQERAPYDLLLCDPPWAEVDGAVKTLARLLGALVFSPGARVVLEHAARGTAPNPSAKNLDLLERRAWGDTAVSVFVVGSPRS